MRNLILHQTHIQSLLGVNTDSNTFPMGYWLDEFSKVLCILDSELKILIFSYENSDAFSNFTLKKTVELEMILGSGDGFEILTSLMNFVNSHGDQSRSIDITNSLIKLLIYKNEDESVHLILASGIYLNIDTESEKYKIQNLFANFTEDINQSQKNILTAEVSPNLEYILLVASNFKIQLINYEFEPILTWKDLDDLDGSNPELDSFLCQSASVSWRGDSAFFCVLYSINGGRKCLVRDTKFNIIKGPARADNKVVFSTAEGVNKNLGNLISWQPSGSLIAYFQEGVLWDESTRVNHCDRAGVLFSEKNCLRHGEFWIEKQNLNTMSNTNSVNSNSENIKLTAKFLKWNMDLPLLAVYFDSINLVAIFHRSNYEWSLKYSYYLKENEKLFSLKFSDALSLRIYSLFTNGKFCTTEYKFEYQNSLNNYNFSDNNGSVSVISGRKIKLTPLGVANIPPPLCFETIKINDTRTPPYLLSHWKNFIFVLSDDNIDYIVIDHKGKKYSLHEGLLNQNIEQSNILDTRYIKNFIFTTNEDLTIGYFVIIKNILDNDLEDELITLEFDINFNNEGVQFLKFNKKNSHQIERCNGVFNSMVSEELYDKDYYRNRENLILTDKEEKNSNSIQTEKNLSTGLKDEDDLFYNLVGMNTNKEKNLNFEDLGNFNQQSSNNFKPSNVKDKTSKYFYIIQQHNKEKSFKKMTISSTSSKPHIEDTNIFTSLDIIKSHSIITHNHEEKIIYLTKNNRLFLNNTLLALDITSFEYFKHFLLFTQSSNTPYNTLHIIDLNKKDFLLCANKTNMNANISQNDEGLFIPDFNYKSFSLRTLERSSLIVAVSKVNLVLQMSRGNLETIYPRLLVLNLIVELISKRDYRQAFELVRKHKINTNFIYDSDPEGFLNNIPSFLSQVEKSDYINLFLNGLENSICEEMLQIDSNDLKEDFKKLYINNKINKICDEMRKHLVTINKDNKYLTSILHTHTKKSPPEYLPALKLVQSLKILEKNKLKLEELVSGATKPLNGSADKALEYLCWVVNADTLFDFALKTYDFELVIMVAKHTQKDPKEFLPYLKKLQDLSEVDAILMKYQVNIDLKNYEDALYELSLGEGKYFDKCVELITKYELYEQSFKLFSDENSLKKLYKFYGDYLRNSKKNLGEAAWAYLRSGSENYENSLKCFADSGNVNGVMTVIKHISDNAINCEELQSSQIKNSIFEILSEMVDTCTASKKIHDIEKIYLYVIENESKLNLVSEDHVGHNIINLKSKIMDSLIRSKKWKSAYLFYTHEVNLLNINKDNSTSSSVLKESNILREFLDGINLSANLQINELKKNISFFEEKYRRLLKVQHLKRTQPHLFILDPNIAMEDNVSDSGSVVSGLSNLSNTKSKKSSMSKMSKSSKNSKMTKKSKNKIAKRNVKEGSPLEEEFLITILEELKLSDEDIENFRELVRVLNFNKNSSIADEIESLLQSYIETVNSTVKNLLSVAQQDFINTHPEIKELFPGLNLSDFYAKDKVAVAGKSFKTTSG